MCLSLGQWGLQLSVFCSSHICIHIIYIMFIKHTSKKIYMHASNEYPGPLLFALWSMINQQILRYMIFGYVTQSWAFPVLFRISVLPSQDPMVFSACMGNQQHLVHWNRSLLHCGFYQLQLLPGISLQLRKIWQPNSGHFGHVWMSFQMIQDDSQEDSSTSSKILNIRILQKKTKLKAFHLLFAVRGHQGLALQSSVPSAAAHPFEPGHSQNAQAPNFNGGKCRRLTPLKFHIDTQNCHI